MTCSGVKTTAGGAVEEGIWLVEATAVESSGADGESSDADGKISGAVVMGSDAVVEVGSGRDGLGGSEDMIEPKLSDTKLLWRC